MLTGRLKRLIACVTMVALVAAMAALPAFAQAKVVLDVYDENYTPKNPVADNITRLYVNKLDKNSREHVKGAMLCIINESTGQMVGEPWESNGTAHEIARNVEGVGKDGALDIDTWYILKELKVPEGYSGNFKDLQDDPNTPHLIRFRIHSDDFNTTGELQVDDEIKEFVDSSEMHGSGPEQAFVINLYNEAIAYEETVRTETNRQNNESGGQVETGNSTSTSSSTSARSTTSSSTSTSGLTKTGDDTNYTPVIVAAVAGVAIIAGAIVWKRKK